MTNPFKAGDRVRCIRGSKGYFQSVAEGVEYTVKRATYSHVYLEGTAGGGWCHDRFELVTELKFKVGDRVVFTSETPKMWWAKPGYTGRVLRRSSSGFGWDVEVDAQWRKSPSYSVILSAPDASLELIPTVTEAPAPAPKTYIISLRKPDGSFAPAPKPRTYSTDKQAEAVAKTMADKHGGDFVVFEAVLLASRPPVVVPPVTVTSL